MIYTHLESKLWFIFFQILFQLELVVINVPRANNFIGKTYARWYSISCLISEDDWLIAFKIYYFFRCFHQEIKIRLRYHLETWNFPTHTYATHTTRELTYLYSLSEKKWLIFNKFSDMKFATRTCWKWKKKAWRKWKKTREAIPHRETMIELGSKCHISYCRKTQFLTCNP